jgi:hypothetical protein
VQKEILEKHPSSGLRVYVVWFSMLPTDARSRWGWTGGVLTDTRAVHFWDENKIVGRWFAGQGSTGDSDGGIVWDTYYLYGPNAQWDSKPEPLIGTGATVRAEVDKLKNELVPLLK